MHPGRPPPVLGSEGSEQLCPVLMGAQGMVPHGHLQAEADGVMACVGGCAFLYVRAHMFPWTPARLRPPGGHPES